jgi:hypothetical protein
MAVIVVKDHLPCNRPEKIGGCGLEFLNKPSVNNTASPFESCNRNNDDCSTNMSILVHMDFMIGVEPEMVPCLV